MVVASEETCLCIESLDVVEVFGVAFLQHLLTVADYSSTVSQCAVCLHEEFVPWFARIRYEALVIEQLLCVITVFGRKPEVGTSLCNFEEVCYGIHLCIDRLVAFCLQTIPFGVFLQTVACVIVQRIVFIQRAGCQQCCGTQYQSRFEYILVHCIYLFCFH